MATCMNKTKAKQLPQKLRRPYPSIMTYSLTNNEKPFNKFNGCR